MPAYRFCRAGDIPLLVEAFNTCFQVHFADVAPMTVEDFKRDAREIDLWASSCMVASAGREPIGVLFAAKRESANRILSVGVRPDHQGQGHGRHMLESLSQKLSILGPRRMLAELPEPWRAGQPYLESCGYRIDRGYLDFLWSPGSPQAARVAEGLSDLIVPVTVDDLSSAGLLDAAGDRCWDRAPEALLKYPERLRGIAIGAGDRIGAWLLVDERADRPERALVGLHATDPDPGRAGALLGTLVGTLQQSDDRPIRLHRAHAGEIDPAWMERWGFTVVARAAGFISEATAP